MVWTAAHCLRDQGRRGRWASKWVFVPGYQQGERPYGSWPAQVLWTSNGWVRKNDNMDYGAAQIARSNGTGVQTAVGFGLPFGANQPVEQDWEAIGYPADSYFDDALWHCRSPYALSDPELPQFRARSRSRSAATWAAARAAGRGSAAVPARSAR